MRVIVAKQFSIKEATLKKHSHEQFRSEHNNEPANSSGMKRRDLLRKTPLALAAGSIE
jgi:hypothetical protein